ncbi:MAG: NUDIX hydrolase [Solirubrobacterales bacterium]
MDLSEKTIKTNCIYKGRILTLEELEVALPDGKTGRREIVRHNGAVAVIPYVDHETVLLVEQFRKAVEKTLLEVPAGKIEKDEEPLPCAIRELEEETGYKSDKITFLGKVVTSPGFCDEYIYLYKAEDLYPGDASLGDEDEFINIHKVKVNNIKGMIREGKIEDAKTICAFMME